MPGVQAESNVRRRGGVEELLRLLGRFNIGRGVRMEDQVQAKLLGLPGLLPPPPSPPASIAENSGPGCHPWGLGPQFGPAPRDCASARTRKGAPRAASRPPTMRIRSTTILVEAGSLRTTGTNEPNSFNFRWDSSPSQHVGVGGQKAVRSQLGAGVAREDHLIQHLLVALLPRGTRDSPRPPSYSGAEANLKREGCAVIGEPLA